MSSYYDVQQVCINGHQITEYYNSYTEYRKDFCDLCGEKTIHACPKCSTPIKGYHHVDGIVGFGSVPVPDFCEKCGERFPWANRKVDLPLAKDKDVKDNSLSYISRICDRFHLVVKQLRVRREQRNTLDVSDEYDVQDLMHSLLRLYFDDIRTEEWAPSYAGKCSRMDFLIKKEQIVIETKMTRKGLTAKEIGAQLIEDIARYRVHPDCNTLYCFVYDPEDRISNPTGIETDL